MNCPTCGRDTRVAQTRDESCITKRRRHCTHCGAKFWTYEIDDQLAGTLKKYLVAHIKAVERQRALTMRNERIEQQLRAGEKHAVVADQHGLSHNMISTIARRLGIPSRRKKATTHEQPTFSSNNPFGI